MKNFIIVAGVDYHPVSENKRGTDFLHYCNKYYQKTYLKEKISREDLFFYIVDIKRGKINLITHNYDSSTNVYTKKTLAYKTFDPVTSSNYFDLLKNGHKYFHRNAGNIISKFTIYNLIELIGKDNPATLNEVSIFSHAYFDGPILVNSLFQNTNYLDYLNPTKLIDVVSLGRDPNDYDMRRWDFYDFYSRVSNNKKISLLKAAFAQKGLVKIWGCSFPKLLNYFLSKIRKNNSFKPSGLKNNVKFEFTPYTLKIEIIDFINLTLNKNFKKSDIIYLSFLEIKTIFCNQLTLTYSSIGSKLIDKNFQAAIPTTFADIYPIFKISSKTIKNVEFYKNYFDIKTDNLNYGIYEPDFDCTDFYN